MARTKQRHTHSIGVIERTADTKTEAKKAAEAEVLRVLDPLRAVTPIVMTHRGLTFIAWDDRGRWDYDCLADGQLYNVQGGFSDRASAARAMKWDLAQRVWNVTDGVEAPPELCFSREEASQFRDWAVSATNVHRLMTEHRMTDAEAMFAMSPVGKLPPGFVPTK